jgi:hypothetical protein
MVLPMLALVTGVAIGLLHHTGPAAEPGGRNAGSTQTAGGGLGTILITGIRDDGSSVQLTWIDPSGGQAFFVVSQITGSGAQPLRQVPPGETETVVSGLDPTYKQYCFRVLAVVSGADTAASATICTPQRTSATAT